MEAHHGSMAPGKEKHFKHYVFEFIMLFLAVTAGFFAENVREHIVESKKEKEYIRTIIEDLKKDTVSLDGYLKNHERAISAFDSTILLLNKSGRTISENQRLYFLIRIAIRYSDFPKIIDNGYDQMKSSGNLRLIRRQPIADSISRYYLVQKDVTETTSELLLRQWGLIEYEGKIFDGNVFHSMIDLTTFEISPPTGNPPLITEDKKVINEFIVKVHYNISIMLFSRNATKRQFDQATRLVNFLKNEYHLD